MITTLLDLVQQLLTSPYVYLALFVLAALDAVVPVVPSEVSVISAGVLAADGGPEVLLVVAAAALGAFAGDHLAYALGAGPGSRLLARTGGASRWRRSARRVEQQLAVRGGALIIAARYAPGGRTVVSTISGATRYPLRRFSAFTALAATAWALYVTGLGYLFGATFHGDPLLGLGLGLGVAAGTTAAVEVARALVHRRRRLGAADVLHPAAEARG